MVAVSDIVTEALQNGNPVVALETAVLTSGLPKKPWQDSFGECPPWIDASLPINRTLAHAMTARVLANNSVPAWIGVIDGELRIGLSTDEVDTLCSDLNAGKVSLATIAQSLQGTHSAGTTVAATLLACTLSSPEHPIRVFATGGIGGVHQNWSTRLDVSADLVALATTPTCVVASGVKSILDLHATVEALEASGVPTLGLECDNFPPFIEQPTENDPHVFRVESPHHIATICKSHWISLGLKSAVLATVPVPEHVAIKRGSLEETLQKAELAWLETNQPSDTRTPYLLHELAIMTNGQSLLANLELLCNNASVASEIAVALAT